MKTHKWSKKLTALLLVFVMMFALAANASAAYKAAAINGNGVTCVTISAKTGQYIAVHNAYWGSNVDIWNNTLTGCGTTMTPDRTLHYRVKKGGTLKFYFQNTYGGYGNTTMVELWTY